MTLLVLWPVLFFEAFVPGWVLLRGCSRWEEEDCMLLAAPTSALVMGMIGLAGLALRLPADTTAWTALLAPLAVGLGVAALRRRRILPARREHRALLLFWFATTSLLLALETRIPAHVGGGWFNDWMLSYQLSDWYGHHGRLDAVFFDVYTPISRPPLFYLVNGLSLVRWYGLFDLYQWSATVWNSTLLFGAWAWVRHRPGAARWWALAALLLLPAVCHNLLYPWPKGMATGLCLLGLHYFRRWDKGEGRGIGWTAALLFGVAYFCHQLTLAYVAGVGVYLCVLQWRRLSRPRVAAALAGLAVVLLVSLPWWAWSAQCYGVGKTLSASPVVARILDRTGYDMMVTRAYNFAGLVLPENTRRVLAHQPLEIRSWLPRWMEALQTVWRGTLWGNVGIASLVMLAWLAARGRLRRVDTWPGWGFAAFVVAFAIAVQPLREKGGLAQVALLPLAVLMFVWTTELFDAALSRHERWIWMALVTAEFAAACPAWMIALIGARTAGTLPTEPGVHYLYELPGTGQAAMVLAVAAFAVLAALIGQKAIDKRKDRDSLVG